MALPEPESLIDVTYSVDRSGPPKFTQLGMSVGASIRQSSLPSGVKRPILPAWTSATQMQPSLSTVAPSGPESNSAVSTWIRGRSSAPSSLS